MITFPEHPGSPTIFFLCLRCSIFNLKCFVSIIVCPLKLIEKKTIVRGTLDTPDHSISWHGTEPSTKSVEVKLVLWE